MPGDRTIDPRRQSVPPVVYLGLARSLASWENIFPTCEQVGKGINKCPTISSIIPGESVEPMKFNENRGY